jgi:hypothetical protein
MTRSDNLYALPEGLPVPEDDGACDLLPGLRLPSILLPSTAGHQVDLAALPGRTVGGGGVARRAPPRPRLVRLALTA